MTHSASLPFYQYLICPSTQSSLWLCIHSLTHLLVISLSIHLHPSSSHPSIMYLSIHLFTHRHQFIHPSIHPCIHPSSINHIVFQPFSIQSTYHPSTCLFYPFTHLYLSISLSSACPSVYSSISICSSIYPFISHVRIYPLGHFHPSLLSICLSINHLFTYVSIYSLTSVHPFIFPPIHRSFIHPSCLCMYA